MHKGLIHYAGYSLYLEDKTLHCTCKYPIMQFQDHFINSPHFVGGPQVIGRCASSVDCILKVLPALKEPTLPVST